MAQLYSTGPAYTYIAFGTAKPQFMGTGKISPQIEIKRHFKPVFNDVGGEVPFDMAKMGKEAITAIEYTRWNDPLYEVLSNDYSGVPGLENALDTGSLILTEGLFFTYWIVFPFASQKPAYKSLIPGYRFPGTYLLGPDRHQQMGTHPKEIFLMFHHLNLYNPLNGSKLLYDFNMSAVINIPPV
jgi:hypothetical protein